jgi:hypothetical protein
VESKFSKYAATIVSGGYLAAQMGIIGAGANAERPECVERAMPCEYRDGQEPEGPRSPLGQLTRPIAISTATANSSAMSAVASISPSVSATLS